MDSFGLDCTQAIDLDINNEFRFMRKVPTFKKPAVEAAYLVPCAADGHKSYPLFEGENVIGRSLSCAIKIEDKVLSKRHAIIEIEREHYLLQDLNSLNGTFKGKLRLKPSVMYNIDVGEKLIFGNIEFKLQLDKQDSFLDRSPCISPTQLCNTDSQLSDENHLDVGKTNTGEKTSEDDVQDLQVQSDLISKRSASSDIIDLIDREQTPSSSKTNSGKLSKKQATLRKVDAAVKETDLAIPVKATPSKASSKGSDDDETASESEFEDLKVAVQKVENKEVSEEPKKNLLETQTVLDDDLTDMDSDEESLLTKVTVKLTSPEKDKENTKESIPNESHEALLLESDTETERDSLLFAATQPFLPASKKSSPVKCVNADFPDKDALLFMPTQPYMSPGKDSTSKSKGPISKSIDTEDPLLAPTQRFECNEFAKPLSRKFVKNLPSSNESVDPNAFTQPCLALDDFEEEEDFECNMDAETQPMFLKPSSSRTNKDKFLLAETQPFLKDKDITSKTCGSKSDDNIFLLETQPFEKDRVSVTKTSASKKDYDILLAETQPMFSAKSRVLDSDSSDNDKDRGSSSTLPIRSEQNNVKSSNRRRLSSKGKKSLEASPKVGTLQFEDSFVGNTSRASEILCMDSQPASREDSPDESASPVQDFFIKENSVEETPPHLNLSSIRANKSGELSTPKNLETSVEKPLCLTFSKGSVASASTSKNEMATLTESHSSTLKCSDFDDSAEAEKIEISTRSTETSIQSKPFSNMRSCSPTLENLDIQSSAEDKDNVILEKNQDSETIKRDNVENALTNSVNVESTSPGSDKPDLKVNKLKRTRKQRSNVVSASEPDYSIEMGVAENSFPTRKNTDATLSLEKADIVPENNENTETSDSGNLEPSSSNKRRNYKRVSKAVNEKHETKIKNIKINLKRITTDDTPSDSESICSINDDVVKRKSKKGRKDNSDARESDDEDDLPDLPFSDSVKKQMPIKIKITKNPLSSKFSIEGATENIERGSKRTRRVPTRFRDEVEDSSEENKESVENNSALKRSSRARKGKDKNTEDDNVEGLLDSKNNAKRPSRARKGKYAISKDDEVEDLLDNEKVSEENNNTGLKRSSRGSKGKEKNLNDVEVDDLLDDDKKSIDSNSSSLKKTRGKNKDKNLKVHEVEDSSLGDDNESIDSNNSVPKKSARGRKGKVANSKDDDKTENNLILGDKASTTRNDSKTPKSPHNDDDDVREDLVENRNIDKKGTKESVKENKESDLFLVTSSKNVEQELTHPQNTPSANSNRGKKGKGKLSKDDKNETDLKTDSSIIKTDTPQKINMDIDLTENTRSKRTIAKKQETETGTVKDLAIKISDIPEKKEDKKLSVVKATRKGRSKTDEIDAESSSIKSATERSKRGKKETLQEQSNKLHPPKDLLPTASEETSSKGEEQQKENTVLVPDPVPEIDIYSVSSELQAISNFLAEGTVLPETMAKVDKTPTKRKLVSENTSNEVTEPCTSDETETPKKRGRVSKIDTKITNKKSKKGSTDLNTSKDESLEKSEKKSRTKKPVESPIMNADEKTFAVPKLKGGKRNSSTDSSGTPAKKGRQTGKGSNTSLNSLKSNSPTLDGPSGKLGEAKASVLFTGISDPEAEEIITSLGGQVVTEIKNCTHLCTDKFRRTVKFLCCVGQGTPIVGLNWIKACKKGKCFVDVEAFILKDKAAETTHKFKLTETLKKSAQSPLLDGWSIHVTSSVVPGPEQMKEIIESAGGKFLAKSPTRFSEKTVVISHEGDRKLATRLAKLGFPVVTNEFVLTGLVRNKIDFKEFAF